MHESINRPATVSFFCPVCKGRNYWDVSVAPYDLTKDDPRQAIGISETAVPCPDCFETTYTIVVENHGRIVKTFIRDHPDIAVKLETYEITRYEDFLYNYYPTDPLSTFRDAKLELTALILQTPEHVRNSATFARMAFLQWMGMMEAYLADRLIGIVLNDLKVMIALIGKAGLDQKFTLFQIAKEPNLVANTIKAHLQHVIYHDVEKVEKLYQSVFKSGIYTQDTRKFFLEKAEIRHHFVHRNGRDKKGNFVPITMTEAVEFGEMVDQLIDVCEREYSKYQNSRYSILVSVDDEPAS